MAQNPTVKSLLFNARLLYLVKYKAVINNLGADDSRITDLDKKYQTLFTHWANPKFWGKDIPWVAGKTSRLILDLDEVNPSRSADFMTKATVLFQHFKGELLKDALDRIGRTDTSTWNLRMLNAIRKTRQQEDGRVAFFNRQGNDLGNNTEFQEMKTHQDGLIVTYTELLVTNALQATESKVSNVRKRGATMEKETVLADFFEQYKKFNRYINKQITDVSLIPQFANVPSDENQKSLNALSLTLIKMDQEIGKLAVAGKDFTTDAAFPSLSSDQLSLQTNYRNALQSNNITSSTSDTDDIVQIANQLANVNDLSDMKKEYKALNDLMRSRVSATT